MFNPARKLSMLWDDFWTTTTDGNNHPHVFNLVLRESLPTYGCFRYGVVKIRKI